MYPLASSQRLEGQGGEGSIPSATGLGVFGKGGDGALGVLSRGEVSHVFWSKSTRSWRAPGQPSLSTALSAYPDWRCGSIG